MQGPIKSMVHEDLNKMGVVVQYKRRTSKLPATPNQVSLKQEPTESGNTGPWLVDNQSPDPINELWLVVYLIRSVLDKTILKSPNMNRTNQANN